MTFGTARQVTGAQGLTVILSEAKDLLVEVEIRSTVDTTVRPG